MTGPEVDDAPARSRKRRAGSGLREFAVLVVVALLLSVGLQTFVGRVYLIPSESMEPTLHGCAGCTGDRIIVDKIAFRFGDPRPGDAIVFRSPTSSWDTDYHSTRSDKAAVRMIEDVGSVVGVIAPDENDLVKRVIATGGQTVMCCDDAGRVQVDGMPVNETYIVMDFPFVPGLTTCTTTPRSGRCFGPVTVPQGNLWVMGDNRNHSADSRFHVTDELSGTVPVDSVIGKVRVIAWPPSRWGSVDSPATGHN